MKATPDDTIGLLSMHFMSSVALVVVESCSQSALSFCFFPPVTCELCYLFLSSIDSVSWSVDVIFRVISWYALGLFGSITYVDL
jgi:hypothetical protein